MGSAIVKKVDFVMLSNRVFRQPNPVICVVPSCGGGGRFANAQESRFRVPNAQIWAVPPCRGVEFVMLRNRVITCQTFKYKKKLLTGRSFADAWKLLFQAAK